MISIFHDLCDLYDQLDLAVQALDPGPRKDHLCRLANRLYTLIYRTLQRPPTRPRPETDTDTTDTP